MRRTELEKRESKRATCLDSQTGTREEEELLGPGGAPETVTVQASPSSQLGEQESQEIEEHLRALGYIE